MTQPDAYRRLTACRVCRDHDRLLMVLSLGDVPLANALVDNDEDGAVQARYPLELVRCTGCGHLQLSVVVRPDVMFQNYPYVSGTSPTMREHFAAMAHQIESTIATKTPASHARPLVVELGSNDGTLLAAFSPAVDVLGVEPATNIAAIATARGIRTSNSFFSADVARTIQETIGCAAAIVGNNVVAHIDDLDDLAVGVNALLADDGAFIFEVPHLLPMLERVEFDTIYHEHLSYFSLNAVCVWLGRHDLEVHNIEQQTVHGGTIRVWAGRRGAHAVDGQVRAVLDAERAAGLLDAAPWKVFADRVAQIRTALPALIATRHAMGRRVGAYGAAAKGNTMLCACGLGAQDLAYVVDRNPLKQGRRTPGALLPIRGPEALVEDPVDDLVVLAWNFFDEIRAQLTDFTDRGGVYIVPLPSPRVVDD